MPRHKALKGLNLHSLKRPKIRQTWSKWNLYNLARIATPPAAQKTFFQQKWVARSMTRGYHHPQLREKQWVKMFDRRLPAVVPMDYRYLAKHDGSEMGMGRGGGLDEGDDLAPGGGRKRQPRTPYMHMTFFPLERRLDTAVWRALFASSTQQARQFVIHGAVKVNGQKMVHPGYRLNPGDMFSVDPEKVLYATGQQKARSDSPASKRDRAAQAERKAQRRLMPTEEMNEETDGSEADSVKAEANEDGQPSADQTDPKKALRQLMIRASRVLDNKQDLSGTRRNELREYGRVVKRTLSKLRGIPYDQVEDTVEGLETGLAEILIKIPQDKLPKAEATIRSAEQQQQTEGQLQSSDPQVQDANEVDSKQVKKDAELLAAALVRARENPVDKDKPYATPWRPRDYMSAFAFIPRYLEVNQNICSAVYLRHPVARPGLAEVPTPFHGETMGLAFNWYLRRR